MNLRKQIENILTEDYKGQPMYNERHLDEIMEAVRESLPSKVKLDHIEYNQGFNKAIEEIESKLE